MKKLVLHDGDPEDPYLVRWTLWSSRWFGVGGKLHRVYRRDRDRHLHDHPWWFFSIVLRGGYWEACAVGDPSGVKQWWRRVRWWNFKRATGVHRIVTVEPNTWTLVFTGRRCREWGFWTEHGWVPWGQYLFEPGWQENAL